MNCRFCSRPRLEDTTACRRCYLKENAKHFTKRTGRTWQGILLAVATCARDQAFDQLAYWADIAAKESLSLKNFIYYTGYDVNKVLAVRETRPAWDDIDDSHEGGYDSEREDFHADL